MRVIDYKILHALDESKLGEAVRKHLYKNGEPCQAMVLVLEETQ